MSLPVYEQNRRTRTVQNAIRSIQREGIAPPPSVIENLNQWAAGLLTFEEVRRRVLTAIIRQEPLDD